MKLFKIVGGSKTKHGGDCGDSVIRKSESGTTIVKSWSMLVLFAGVMISSTALSMNKIVVNTTDDRNLTCGDHGLCSLREAINLANSDADMTKIRFKLRGNSSHQINLQSLLPVIQYPIDIDGSLRGHGSRVILEARDISDNCIRDHGNPFPTNSGARATGVLFIGDNDDSEQGSKANGSIVRNLVIQNSANLGKEPDYSNPDPAALDWSLAAVDKGPCAAINVGYADKVEIKNIDVLGGFYTGNAAINIWRPGTEASIINNSCVFVSDCIEAIGLPASPPRFTIRGNRVGSEANPIVSAAASSGFSIYNEAIILTNGANSIVKQNISYGTDNALAVQGGMLANGNSILLNQFYDSAFETLYLGGGGL